MVKNPPANAGDLRDVGSIPQLGMIPWRRAWQPIPVLLPGESHGQRSLVDYSPEHCKELDTTEQLSMHAYMITEESSPSPDALAYLMVSIYSVS